MISGMEGLPPAEMKPMLSFKEDGAWRLSVNCATDLR